MSVLKFAFKVATILLWLLLFIIIIILQFCPFIYTFCIFCFLVLFVVYT